MSKAGFGIRKRKGWQRFLCMLSGHPTAEKLTVTIAELGVFSRDVCDCGHRVKGHSEITTSDFKLYPIDIDYETMRITAGGQQFS